MRSSRRRYPPGASRMGSSRGAPGSPRPCSMSGGGLRHLRNAEAHDAGVRRDAIRVRLTRERALAVLDVAVMRAARHVVRALESDRARNGHLSTRGRGRCRRSDGRRGVRGCTGRLLVRRCRLRIRAGLLRVRPGLRRVAVRDRSRGRRGRLLRGVLLGATRRKHDEE